MPNNKPTAEQLAALGRFARAYGHGRRWKQALRSYWEASRYPGVAEIDVPVLQGLRNQFGPSWLAGLRLGDLPVVELPPPADLSVENHGSIAMLRVLTPAGQEWVDENVHSESWQWMGNGLAVEPRMVQVLVEGAVNDGLVVR